MGASTTGRDLGQIESEDVVVPTERALDATTLTGRSLIDRVEFDGGSRTFSFEPQFLAVTACSSSFGTPYAAYVGLAPPLSLGDKRTSVLTQAQEAGLIDHAVFSLYTALDHGLTSSVKFGSYDEAALAPGAEIVYVKTKGTGTWELPGYALALHEDLV